jgi:hypothetical protein
MKKNLAAICLIIFGIAAFLSDGCKKENTPPAITLMGDSHITAYKGETYTDQGASATDNEDGDLTSKIQMDGTVGTAPGVYTLNYSVTDKEGNYASTQRIVTVMYKSTTLAGSYSVTETSPFGTVTYTGSVTADSVDLTHFVFGSLSAPDPIVIDAQIINRDEIGMITDVQGGPITQFQGNITEPTHITFTLSYLRPISTTTTNCTAVWVKN